MKIKPTITFKEWQILRKSVLERDNYTCNYCGIKKNNMCVDHIIPLSRNGTDDLSNLTACCRSCNSGKRNRTPEEWIKGVSVPRISPYERFNSKPNKVITYRELKKLRTYLSKKELSLLEYCKIKGLSNYMYDYLRRHIKWKQDFACSYATYIKLADWGY